MRRDDACLYRNVTDVLQIDLNMLRHAQTTVVALALNIRKCPVGTSVEHQKLIASVDTKTSIAMMSYS